MNKTVKNILSAMLCAAVALSFSGCKKDKDDDSTPSEDLTGTNTVKIEFNHKVNGFPLELNTGSYTNANGDTFSVSKFLYYISNVEFKKADGTTYSMPVDNNSSAGYFLVDQADDNSKLISIPDVPAGDYTSMSFIIGVDAARNSAGAQTGALDPANGMFWSWNSGYIYCKMEGTSPQSAMGLTFHIGGFKDPNNCVRTVSPSLNNEIIKVRKTISPEVHMFVDVAEMFKTSTTVDFAVLNMAMGGPDAVTVANNYVDMFTVDHIHND